MAGSRSRPKEFYRRAKRGESHSVKKTSRSVDKAQYSRGEALVESSRLESEKLMELSPAEEQLIRVDRDMEGLSGYTQASLQPNLLRIDNKVVELERRLGIWQQSSAFKSAILAVCLSAITQGWAQSTTSGAHLAWTSELGLGDVSSSQSILWKIAFANAVTFLAAAFSCTLSEPLQWLGFGRRGMLFGGALISITASIASACVSSWYWLLVCRILLGVAMGTIAFAGPVYAAEISPTRLRPTVMTNWALSEIFGFLCGHAVNLVVPNLLAKSSWRLHAASVSLPALCLAVIIWTIPESPRFLLQQGDANGAVMAMTRLRRTSLSTSIDFVPSEVCLRADLGDVLGITEENLNQNLAHAKRPTWWRYVADIWRSPRNRNALKAALVVMVAQQLCGFNILASYGAYFPKIGEPTSKAGNRVYLHFIFASLNLLCAIQAHHLVEKWGRRTLLLRTYSFMTMCMLALCLTFMWASDDALRFACLVILSLFTLFYSAAPGSVPFTYMTEVLPLKALDSGMSLARAANFIIASWLEFSIPTQQFCAQGESYEEALHGKLDVPTYYVAQDKLFGTFLLLNLTILVLVFIFVPETKHNSIGEGLNNMTCEDMNTISERVGLDKVSLSWSPEPAKKYVSLLKWPRPILPRRTIFHESTPNYQQNGTHLRPGSADFVIETAHGYDLLGDIKTKVPVRIKHKSSSTQTETQTQIPRFATSYFTQSPGDKPHVTASQGDNFTEMRDSKLLETSPIAKRQDDQNLDMGRNELQDEGLALTRTESSSSSSTPFSVDPSQSTPRFTIRSTALILVRAFIIYLNKYNERGGKTNEQHISNCTSSLQQVSAASTEKASKRKRRSGGDEDEDDLRHRRIRQLPSSNDDEEFIKLRHLACPFNKYDSFLFGVASVEKSYRVCGQCSFTNISHLKQHFERVHYLPDYYCYRCCCSFADEECLAEHQRATQQCQPCHPPKHCEKIKPSLVKSLKLKTRNICGTDRETEWRRIFHGLFPSREDWQTISAFYEGPNQWLMSTFATFSDRQVERAFQEASRRLGHHDQWIMAVFQEVRNQVLREATEMMRSCLHRSQMPHTGSAGSTPNGQARSQAYDSESTGNSTDSGELQSSQEQASHEFMDAAFDSSWTSSWLLGNNESLSIPSANSLLNDVPLSGLSVTRFADIDLLTEAASSIDWGFAANGEFSCV